MESVQAIGLNASRDYTYEAASAFEFQGNTMPHYSAEIEVEEFFNTMPPQVVAEDGFLERGVGEIPGETTKLVQPDANHLTVISNVTAAAHTIHSTSSLIHESFGAVPPAAPLALPTLPPIVDPRNTAAYNAIRNFETNFTNSLRSGQVSEYGILEGWVRKLESHELHAYRREQSSVPHGNHMAEPSSKRRKTRRH